MQLPVFDIDLAAFKADPYPQLERMRAQSPVCFVPQLNGICIAKRDDIFVCEKNEEVFSAVQPNGMMVRLMGQNMMRKDGEAHMAERRMMFPAVSPRTVADVWKSKFLEDAHKILDEFEPKGRMDVVHDYAMRLSGEALKLLTGLTQIHWSDMDAWSQGMIDGISNYTRDPEVEAHCNACTAAIDAAITERLPEVKANPDHSIMSVFLQGGMPEENIRHNIKLTISGGQNEPRDAIAGLVWAMLSHPDELARVRNGEATWHQAFEEYCRWMSPVGMVPRRVAKPATYNGYDLPQDSMVFMFFSSANRDESCFEDPTRFDITRDTAKSIPFGAGPHFCAGAWASRALVADIGVPVLFERLPNIKLEDADSVVLDGWTFRGPLDLPVVW